MEKNNQIYRNQHQPELSVVVLGYRASQKLRSFVDELVGYLRKDNIDYQIVLVGNYWPGSEDITPLVVKELAQANSRIKPVVKPKQGGMGWDMRSGLETADGKLITIIDGDGQMPAKDVIRVYQKIKEENLDFVKTYREKRFDNSWRKTISFFYNLFFKILFPGLNIIDVNSKPKILNRELFNKLNLTSDDWFVDAEMMIQIRRHNIRIGEIPTVFKESEKKSSFVKFPAIFEFIKNLIKARIHESLNYWRDK